MAEERKTGMDYPVYNTPKSVVTCMRILSECRKIRQERLAIQRKLLNRHGKLRK